MEGYYRRSIKLGRLRNKYLIIEIIFYAADDDGLAEGEALLWRSSRVHRAFLVCNHDWYPPKLVISPPASLKKQSNELEDIEQTIFMLDRIRILPFRKVQKVYLLYRASRDGWQPSDFHSHCDNKGPTLTLIRSSRGFLAAGFT